LAYTLQDIVTINAEVNRALSKVTQGIVLKLLSLFFHTAG